MQILAILTLKRVEGREFAKEYSCTNISTHYNFKFYFDIAEFFLQCPLSGL